jgi:hypothetical protein
MEELMEEFVWTVCIDGYDSIEVSCCGSDSSTHLAITSKGKPGYLRIRAYAPLAQVPGLHRTFAALTPQPFKIVEFANRFGLLGCPVSSSYMRMESSAVERGRREPELLTDWIAQSQKLKDALSLWDRTGTENREQLQGGPQDRPPGDTRGVGRQSYSNHAETRETLNHLLSIVNQNLDALGVETRLVWDFNRELVKMTLVPRNLLGAIWAEFALAIGANRAANDYQRCEACGIFFEKRGLKRADAVYCSNACKSRAYRNRSPKLET